MRVNPTVSLVTRLAKGSKPRAARPAGYARRWALQRVVTCRFAGPSIGGVVGAI